MTTANDMPRLYATLGPSCQDTQTLTAMIKAGMTGLRINLSHGPLSGCDRWLGHVREAEQAAGRKVDLLIDIQGPEVRLGNFEVFETQAGQLLSLGSEGIDVPMAALHAMKPGMELLVDDGAQCWSVLETDKDTALVQVIRGGMLFPRKSLSLPTGTTVDMPPLSAQDYENLAAAVPLGIRQVMMPFVHSQREIDALRRYWATLTEEPVTIFAKIEDTAGLENLADFIDSADVIVIARGDLGSHLPLPALPAAQMEITAACIERKKPFLVVTQMLHSMIHSPVPTRAEVSDIAFAVFTGASALMLTGETAAGEYPLEAMEYFSKTAAFSKQFAKRQKGGLKWM